MPEDQFAEDISVNPTMRLPRTISNSGVVFGTNFLKFICKLLKLSICMKAGWAFNDSVNFAKQQRAGRTVLRLYCTFCLVLYSPISLF